MTNACLVWKKLGNAYKKSKKDFKRIVIFYEKKRAIQERQDIRRTNLISEILKIDGLHDKGMIATKEVLSKDKDKLDYFYNLPPLLRKNYIM